MDVYSSLWKEEPPHGMNIGQWMWHIFRKQTGKGIKLIHQWMNHLSKHPLIWGCSSPALIKTGWLDDWMIVWIIDAKWWVMISGLRAHVMRCIMEEAEHKPQSSLMLLWKSWGTPTPYTHTGWTANKRIAWMEPTHSSVPQFELMMELHYGCSLL